MKHIIPFLILALVSCQSFDDSALWEKLLEHEERIEKLETMCNQLNANVSALQTILDALQQKDYVTDITRIMEDGVEIGYSITFARKGTVTIYHGSDGNTPQIGIRKASDGEYYWTSNGEWITGENGDRISATAQEEDKDAPYITPRFRVAEGIWYISYDNGNTWMQIEDGKDEEQCIFTEVNITDSEYVVFTLSDGTAISIPLVQEENLKLYQEAKNLVSRYQHQTYINQKNTNENIVDIILFAGQSNSCGRAQLTDCVTEEDIIVEVPVSKAFTFNNTASVTPLEITEPIAANGTSGYGYIPAFLNSYHATTNRKVCACYKSVGGVMINKFVPYVLDDMTGEPTGTQGAYYKSMVQSINHAKTNLTANGYELGEVLLVWCQGESEGVYLGNDNQYAITFEKGLTSDEQKTEWYKKQFISIVDQLKNDVGLSTGFIIRIGQRKPEGNCQNSPVINAQNELGKENDDIVLVSTIFAGAKRFIKEDGSIRNLMRDTSHYLPEGYLRAGLEAGVNAGIYINSGKQIKPILLEYHTLVNDDPTLYERPVDKFLYNPCRIDLNYLKDLTR